MTFHPVIPSKGVDFMVYREKIPGIILDNIINKGNIQYGIQMIQDLNSKDIRNITTISGLCLT